MGPDLQKYRAGLAIVGLDHRLKWVNDVFGQIVGYAPDALVGRLFEEITHPDDANLDAHLAARLFAGDLARYSMEKRYVRCDGSHVKILLRASSIKDASGKIFSALAIVTETKPENSKLPMPERLSETDAEKLEARIRRAVLD